MRIPTTSSSVHADVKRLLGFTRSLAIYHNPVTLRAWRVFYEKILQPGDIVIDVGAHVGTRARAMRAAGAQVIALEPQPWFARFLRLTLPRDIVLIEAAAGATESVAVMAVSSRHPTVSSLQSEFVDRATETTGFDHVRWDRRERVKMVTLDSIIARYGQPAYIKIDVEGFELETLAGLSTPPAMISVEYLPAFADLTFPVLTRLEALGDYRFNPVVGERSGFLWPEWRDGSAVRNWLEALGSSAPSGDLFARLDPSFTP